MLTQSQGIHTLSFTQSMIFLAIYILRCFYLNITEKKKYSPNVTMEKVFPRILALIVELFFNRVPTKHAFALLLLQKRTWCSGSREYLPRDPLFLIIYFFAQQPTPPPPKKKF